MIERQLWYPNIHNVSHPVSPLSPFPQAIVSTHVNSTSGVITALGTRGLPPQWSPRDIDYTPEDGEALSSFVMTLDLETGRVSYRERIYSAGAGGQPFLATLGT